MVVKPATNLTRGRNGLVQPGLKVRGRDDLRIIYGPDYTEPRTSNSSARVSKSAQSEHAACVPLQGVAKLFGLVVSHPRGLS